MSDAESRPRHAGGDDDVVAVESDSMLSDGSDEEDLVERLPDVIDATSFAAFRTMGLDDQGIPWNLLDIDRGQLRTQRLTTYRNYRERLLGVHVVGGGLHQPQPPQVLSGRLTGLVCGVCGSVGYVCVPAGLVQWRSEEARGSDGGCWGMLRRMCCDGVRRRWPRRPRPRSRWPRFRARGAKSAVLSITFSCGTCSASLPPATCFTLVRACSGGGEQQYGRRMHWSETQRCVCDWAGGRARVDYRSGPHHPALLSQI